MTDYTIFTQEQRTNKHKDICERIIQTYFDKHFDYGPSFEKSFHKFGLIAPFVRIEDKLSRLESLMNIGEENKRVNESIKDTVLDAANYLIMLAVELELLEEKDLINPSVNESSIGYVDLASLSVSGNLNET